MTRERLQRFLAESEASALPAAERLRQLGVDLDGSPIHRGWNAYQLIFDMATEIEPQNPDILHSRAISAVTWLDLEEDRTVRQRIADDAIASARRALKLGPEDGHVAYTLGLAHYKDPRWSGDPARYEDAAIGWFDLSLGWYPAPETTVMAKLYRAHTLADRAMRVDQENLWRDALAAYREVDQKQLSEHWPLWRTYKLREQIGHCLFRLGDRVSAERELTRLIDDLEPMSKPELEEAVVNFDELLVVLKPLPEDAPLRVQTRRLIHRADHLSFHRDSGV